MIGVSPKLYNAVAPLLTVNARSPGVDPQVASLAILSLVPGLDLGTVQAWIEQRDQALRDGTQVPPIPFSSPYFAAGQNSVRIRADAVGPTGVRASREASVRMGGVQRGRPQFYLWQKGLPSDALPMTAPASTTSAVSGTLNG